MASTYAPDSDAEVESMVRSLTGYEDDELSAPRFATLLDLTKLTLTTETDLDGSEADTDPWYADGPLGQALVFATAIRTKSAVENYSVDRWDFGGGTIDVSGAGDADQVQFGRWASQAAMGVSQSTEVSSSEPTPRNTSSYIT